jgi:hypothetical protein
LFNSGGESFARLKRSEEPADVSHASAIWDLLGAIGAAMSCFDTALKYSKERIQFGKTAGCVSIDAKEVG